MSSEKSGQQEAETEKKKKTTFVARKIGPGFKILLWIIGILYMAYMWLVFKTSRKTEFNLEGLRDRLARGEKAIGVGWHQDAILSPYFHRHFRPLMMVSPNSSGEFMDVVLRRCNFTTFRGSSSGTYRYKWGRQALRDMIDHLNSHSGTYGGLILDGSRGPARKVQMGALIFSKDTGAPIIAVRHWARRHILLKTWDRTMIPLPFNHLIFMATDPVTVPPDASDEDLELCREELESQLLAITETSENYFQSPMRTKGAQK